MARKAAIVEYWQADNKKWYFHKVARNNRNVGTSQGYTVKASMLKAAKREHPGLEVFPKAKK